MRKELRWIFRTPLYVFGFVAVVLLILGAIASFTLPGLEPWHAAKQFQEGFAYGSYENFANYIADEKRLLDGVYGAIGNNELTANKYSRQSPRSPYVDGENLNASFEMVPESDSLLGGVLLVHGLSDSPYHMRAIAEIFSAHGYYVLGLRLPGHGTAPGALVNVKWQDWYKAVDFAARMVKQKLKASSQSKFIVGGFSTGGALTLRYTLLTVMADSQRVPDRLFLFSPAIAITPKAVLANWHKLVAWLPYYEKFRWDEIKDEDDPFKYNSFPKNAGDQIHLLTKVNSDLADKMRDDAERRRKIPPIFAFQSPVDATVKAGALLGLFEKVGNPESELVWFDVNHVYADSFEPKKRETLPHQKLSPARFHSRLIVVSNRGQSADSAEFVKFYQAQPESDNEQYELVEIAGAKTMAWPEKAFALSHVCIPISPLDRFYGQESALGRIDPNQDVMVGEKRVLVEIAHDSGRFRRIRYNPFFDFVRARIEFALAQNKAH